MPPTGVDTSPSLLSGFAFDLPGATQHLYVAAAAGSPPNPWRILAVGFAAAGWFSCRARGEL